MKYFAVILILAGAGYAFYASGQNPIKAIQEVVAPTDATREYVEMIASDGRTLQAKVTARRGPFLEIEREVDQQRFLLPVEQLSEDSRRKLKAVADFNEETLNKHIFEQAKQTMTVEVLSVPKACTFICPQNGERLNTKHGAERDYYITLLRELGIPYRETSLHVEWVGENGYRLPQGVKSAPCVRIGQQYAYSHNSAKLKEAYIEAYFQQSIEQAGS